MSKANGGSAAEHHADENASRSGPGTSAPAHDVFISYSRTDVEFARGLQNALQSHRSPRKLGGSERLRVFRDEEDFTGVEYHEAIEKQLRNSKKLIVVCSPHARRSRYVNDEIRRFAQSRGPDHIVPILLSGVPNNAALPGQENDMAFPDALCETLKMPVAVSYAGFDTHRHKIGKGLYYGPWYATLANVYGLQRDEIEQRDKKRRAQRLRITAGIVTGVIAALSIALIFALASRRDAIDARNAEAVQRQMADASAKEAREQRDVADIQRKLADDNRIEAQQQRTQADQNAARAEEQRRVAVSRQLAAHSSLLRQDQLDLSLLLSWEAYAVAPTSEAQSAILSSLLESGRLVAILRAHEASVSSIAFSPDGQRLATGGSDGGVILWDFLSRKPIYPALVGLKSEVKFLEFGDRGLALLAAAEDGTILLWDLATRQGTLLPQPTRSQAAALGFRADGRTIWTGSADGSLSVWNAANRQWRTDKLPVSEKSIVAYSRDGTRAAWCDAKGSISLWDSAIGAAKSVAPSLTPESSCDTIALSPVGAAVAAHRGREVDVWDISKTPPETRRMTDSPPFSSELKFSPDGKSLAVRTYGSVLLWDIDRYASEVLPAKWSSAIAFSPGGSMAVGACADVDLFKDSCVQGELRIWSLENPSAARKTLTGHEGSVTRVAFHPTLSMVASADEDGRILVRDPYSGKIVADLRAGDDPVDSLVYSSDGALLAAGDEDGTIAVFDSRSNFRAYHLSVPESGDVAALRFTRDSRRLAAATLRDSDSGGISITWWDVSSHELLGQPLHGRFNILDEDNRPRSVEFSPDGSMLAAAYLEKETSTVGGRAQASFSSMVSQTFRSAIDLYDAATGKHLRTLAGTAAIPPALAFGSDGKTLAAAGIGGNGTTTVTLLDVNTFQPRRTLTGEPVGVLDLAVFGDVVVAAGQQITPTMGSSGVSIWNLATGERLGATLPGVITNVALRAGKSVASGQENGEVWVWPLDPREWRAIICRIANRNLTGAEQVKYLGGKSPAKSCPDLP